jgi:putative tryptophan/tyrosine transport system substrate-binding protein
MQRREFITLLGGAAAAWPLAARAQQPDRVRRIGVLMGYAESDPEGQRCIKAFLQGLQELGWAPGRNVQIEYRWGGADPDRIQTYATEIVGLKPDVILAQTALVLVPLQQETQTIPIVFMQVMDPVESGFVASMARPTGNLTGFAPFEASVTTKWLEMLKEISPSVIQVAVILNPDQSPNVVMLRAIEAVAPSLGVHLTVAGVHDAADIERAVNALMRESNGGLIVLPNPIVFSHRELIITLAAQHHLPAVYPYRYFVADGGLMSYGADIVDQYRQAATYIDHILKGAKPADLPVQAPTKYELVINLTTAKALGLTVPPSLLSRADEVIE